MQSVRRVSAARAVDVEPLAATQAQAAPPQAKGETMNDQRSKDLATARKLLARSHATDGPLAELIADALAAERAEAPGDAVRELIAAARAYFADDYPDADTPDGHDVAEARVRAVLAAMEAENAR